MLRNKKKKPEEWCVRFTRSTSQIVEYIVEAHTYKDAKKQGELMIEHVDPYNEEQMQEFDEWSGDKHKDLWVDWVYPMSEDIKDD